MDPERRPRGRARGTRTQVPPPEGPRPGLPPPAQQQGPPSLQHLSLGGRPIRASTAAAQAAVAQASAVAPGASSTQQGFAPPSPLSYETTVAASSELMDENEALESRRRQLAVRYDRVVTLEEGRSKAGSTGQQIELVANYFDITRRQTWELFQYRVDYSPLVDQTRDRKKIMANFAGKEPGKLGFFIFDGTALWTIERFAGTRLELTTVYNNEPVLIKLRLVGSSMPGDVNCLQIYNILIRKCFQLLELIPMGRNYFDHRQPIELRNHGLSLWPGFLASLRQHDHGLLYCIELTHKVIRMDTVLDMIQKKQNEGQRRGASVAQIRNVIKTSLVGNIILAHYNNRTYRLDDISWDMSPRSTFERKGVPTSFVDYYFQRHNIPIKDLQQPILISKPSAQDVRTGRKQPGENTCLIPELCQLTGLSDEMRSNFALMKDLGVHLFQTPAKKLENTIGFVNRIRSNELAFAEMNNWGVQIKPDPLRLFGRVLDREKVLFNPNNVPVDVNPQGDFTMALRGNKMVSSVNLLKWIIIVQDRDAANVPNLVQTMQKVARPLGMEIAKEMRMITVRNTAEYGPVLTKVHKDYGKELEMVFVILSGTNTNNTEVYATVKKRCYVDYGLPSQCFLSKNLTAKGLMSIATKLVIQMNAKLGGIPWTIKIPLQKLMIVGFDVYHGGLDGNGGRKPSVGAMVCTTSPDFGKHFTCVEKFRDGNELSIRMGVSIHRCCAAFANKNNGELPARIIFYRDGVGDGQLAQVYEVEHKALQKQLELTYFESGFDFPKFTMIVVTKRINTRLFMHTRNGIENPPPGTIVDSHITWPERWDFFLVAIQARQGVVSPTNYNVVWDRGQLDANKVQRLTYKLCHQYYNWSGTIAVPSVCQYAHKLAYMVGKVLEAPTHDNLLYRLYFL